LHIIVNGTAISIFPPSHLNVSLTFTSAEGTLVALQDSAGARPGNRAAYVTGEVIFTVGVLLLLHVPRLRAGWAVVEGVTQADLRRGPGHYPSSDDPGAVGNLAIAGHRLPSVFWNLHRMRRGDPVVVETRSGWYVYRVTRVHVVRPWQVEVIRHNPADPERRPTRRLLTLTTCHPRYDNDERLIVQAELSGEQGRRAGRPRELSPDARG
jgi:sortase A